MSGIECPYCKKTFKSLMQHIFYRHNKSLDEFKLEYSNYPLQVSQPTNLNLRCPYCDYISSTKTSFTNHIKYHHPEHAVQKSIKEQIGYECLECNKKKKNLKQHVELTHKLDWVEYCNKYSWSVDKKAYLFSDEHKLALSKNKKLYYTSELGLLRREEQRINISGDKNPACAMDIRRKISISRTGQKMKFSNKQLEKFSKQRFDILKRTENIATYGLYVKFIINDIVYKVRSFEEFKIVWTLIEKNKNFIYEQKLLQYKLPNEEYLHTYLLDLEYDFSYIEIKCATQDQMKQLIHTDSKYKTINDELLKIGKRLEIHSYKTFCNTFGFDYEIDFYFIGALKNLFDNNKIQLISLCIQKGKTPKLISRICSTWQSDPRIRVKFVGLSKQEKEIKDEIL